MKMKFDYWFLSILSIKGEGNEGTQTGKKMDISQVKQQSVCTIISYHIISQITDNR